MGFFFFFIPNAKTNVVIFFVKIRYFIQTTSFFFRIHMEYIIFLQERKFRVEFHYICEGTRRKSGSYNIANNVHSRSNLHKMILIKPYTYIYTEFRQICFPPVDSFRTLRYKYRKRSLINYSAFTYSNYENRKIFDINIKLITRVTHVYEMKLGKKNKLRI